MVDINHHYQKLKPAYFFRNIEQKKNELLLQYPNAKLINLGIGDITKPLIPTAAKALAQATEEMTKVPIGYGSSQGYGFLREKIASFDYKNLSINPDEIFVSDGAKPDCANILEIFCNQSIVALCDPSYPVYVDSTIMAGKTGFITEEGRYPNILYLPCIEENGFLPIPPHEKSDLIYLCSPNNPTGVALTKEILQDWVRYAKKHKAIIIYDGAYEAFITQDRPKSIFEIDGAKEVALEIRSFSKTAGFTGLRCSYTVIPKELKAFHGQEQMSVHDLWKRRHETKFGGVPYPIQRAAEAIYSPQGQKELQEVLVSYKTQSLFLYKGLKNLGFVVYGGVDAPYVWCKIPKGFTSWDYFDYLLQKAHLITIPGSGFGIEGEGFIRLAAFAHQPIIDEALIRLKNL